jgi:hypothetical protein
LRGRPTYTPFTKAGAIPACFELSIPLELIDTVAEGKSMINQSHIADVSHDILSVPVDGLTNLVITLDSPVESSLEEDGIAAVREIQVFALDPGSATQKLTTGRYKG